MTENAKEKLTHESDGGKGCFSGKRLLLAGVLIGAFIASIGSLIAADQIERTNTPEFCASCHEMEVFYQTWEAGAHGSANKGAVHATCTDCHLPPAHDGMVSYLWAKGTSGTKDIVNHYLGRAPDWVANLEHRDVFTYESGCLNCHVELVAPGIPLKAYLAHRDYLTGETESTCISCHAEVGHGNLKYMINQQGELQ